MVTSFKHYIDVTDRSAASCLFFCLSLGLVWVCDLLREKFLSHITVPALGKYNKEQPHADPCRHCNANMTSPSRILAYLGFSGSLFHVFFPI